MLNSGIINSKIYEIKRINELLDPWNHKKTYGFLMISVGIEVN